MLRALPAALLLASTASAQVVSLKTSIPSLAGPGAVSAQAPALNAGLSMPALALSVTPALTPSLALAPSLIPALAAPAAPLAAQAAPLVPGAKAITPLRSAVRTFGEGLRAIPSALSALFDGAAATGEASGPVPSAGRFVRSLDSIRELKVGSYNLLNLFEKVGKHVPDPANPGKLMKVSDTKPKEEWSLRAQGKVILESDLDIVTLAEVENIAALRDFNENYLEGKYELHLIEGNDERGIDVAFLVKKDLPFIVEQRSHKEETWTDPLFPGAPTKLFSRDLTSLVVRAEGRPEPLFVLFGTHFKSKRDRDNADPVNKIVDVESRDLRAAQVQRSAEIIGRYRQEFGANVPLMLAGDFNGEVGHESEFKPLFEAAGLIDSFDASPTPVSEQDRITHSYHPRVGDAKYGQMDAVLVSKGMRVNKAEVYRYKNADGTVRPIPKTYEERELNPSDHYPVIVTLDFAPIRDAWRTPKSALETFAERHLPNDGPEDPTRRGHLLALARAYSSVENPRREAAHALVPAYYDGIPSLERLGRTLAPDTRRQLLAMLVVLETVMPSSLALRHREKEINELIRGFERLLTAFERPAREPRPAEPAPRTHTPAQQAKAARLFADGSRAWLSSKGAGFDATIARWQAWTENPGRVETLTAVNLPAIRTLIDAAAAAKLAFARESALVPKKGNLTPEDVRRLYDAWDVLRSAGSDTLIIVGDSLDPDFSKRGLIANRDQNTAGRHPGGLEIFLTPGEAVDWVSAYTLNDVLRSN